MPLDEADYRLTYKISRRPTAHADPSSLRRIMVSRLTDNFKAVLRRALRTRDISVYCEACERWNRLKEIPGEWHCTGCDRHYRVEFVIYEEIE